MFVIRVLEVGKMYFWGGRPENDRELLWTNAAGQSDRKMIDAYHLII